MRVVKLFRAEKSNAALVGDDEHGRSVMLLVMFQTRAVMLVARALATPMHARTIVRSMAMTSSMALARTWPSPFSMHALAVDRP